MTVSQWIPSGWGAPAGTLQGNHCRWWKQDLTSGGLGSWEGGNGCRLQLWTTREGGFLSGSTGSEPACQCRRCRSSFNPWVGKIPWRRKWQPTPVFLLGKFHGQRSLMSYSPWGCQRIRHKWANEHTYHMESYQRRKHNQFGALLLINISFEHKNAYICNLKASFCWILITGTVLSYML